MAEHGAILAAAASHLSGLRRKMHVGRGDCPLLDPQELIRPRACFSHTLASSNDVDTCPTLIFPLPLLPPGAWLPCLNRRLTAMWYGLGGRLLLTCLANS